MSLKSTYFTVKRRSEGTYKEKGSKFIGIAVPCWNEDEAKNYLSEWRKEHHQARHLCYAYRFGLSGDIYRANDDGEPNNSAGAPILGQIQSFELSNVLIGVVRYYGGTKLGVGGLINAYRTAAKEAIEAAKIIEKEVFEWVDIHFEYADMPGVMNLLKKWELSQESTDFEISCKIKTKLPLNTAHELKEELGQFPSLKIKSLGEY